MKKSLTILLFCLMAVSYVQASVIRAGVISLRQVSDLTIEATTKIVVPSHIDITDLEVCWGDGTCSDALEFDANVNAFQGLKYYTFVNAHTYSTTGEFDVSISHCCYDNEITNIETGGDADFSISSMIVLLSELNTGPTFSSEQALVDADTANSSFVIFGADVDIDGDVYSHELCEPANLVSYSSLDWVPLSLGTLGDGILIWSQPWIDGNYIAQICTEEKRNGTLISRTRRIVCFMVDDDYAIEVSAKEISASSFELFPNPVNNSLFFSSGNSSYNGEVSLNILDLQGRVVANESWRNFSKAELNVDHLAQGVYYVTVLLENGEKYYKQIQVSR